MPKCKQLVLLKHSIGVDFNYITSTLFVPKCVSLLQWEYRLKQIWMTLMLTWMLQTKTALGENNFSLRHYLLFKNIHTDPRWKNLAKLKKSKDHNSCLRQSIFKGKVSLNQNSIPHWFESVSVPKNWNQQKSIFSQNLKSRFLPGTQMYDFVNWASWFHMIWEF